MIRYWNRAEKREETEKVYGDSLVRLLYGTRIGRGLTDFVLAGHALSRAYGAYQGSALSRHKIAPFIRDFNIPMDEYESGPFASFNEFFIRKFRSGARVFVAESDRMPAFAEARYLAWESVTPEKKIPVKGAALSARALLADDRWSREFEGGPLLLARLCPVDYHRFHYPADGTTVANYRVPGRLHSVNPLALKFMGEIFATNERQVSILDTRDFGLLAYVEVGALCVGRIVQTHSGERSFARGEEKGYFLFGASTVIVLGRPDAWKPDSDILEQTARQRETLVRLGDSVAVV